MTKTADKSAREPRPAWPQQSAPVFVATGNPLEALSLYRELLKGRRVALTIHSLRALSRFLLGPARRRVDTLDLKTSAHPGLFYDVNSEAIDATVEYCGKMRRTSLLDDYARRFATGKTETFLRWHFARLAFPILTDLRLLSLQPEAAGAGVILPDAPFVRFLAERVRRQTGIDLPILWTRPPSAAFELCFYFLWLLRQLLRRGVWPCGERARFKFCADAVHGMHREVLRDDLFVDGVRIKPSDVLISTIPSDAVLHERAARECAERGYRCVDETRVPFPIGRGSSELLYFILAAPFRESRRLRREGLLELLPAFLFFRREGLPAALMLARYDIGAFVTTLDWGDLPKTIIANARGTRVFLIVLTDMAGFRDKHTAFLVRDVCCHWGAQVRDIHRPHQKVERYVLSGCPFKASFSRFRARRDELRASLGLRQGPVATFFLTSYDEAIHFDGAFLVAFLESLARCCENNPGTTFLLKPKVEAKPDYNLPPSERAAFDAVWSRLGRASNFKFLLGWRRDPEAAIALSDVVVTMGMTSPSTIALVCGVDALYFDDTAPAHPLAAGYKDALVFDDPELLARRVGEVLAGKRQSACPIPEPVLSGFDAHRDDAALDRIRDALLETVKG